LVVEEHIDTFADNVRNIVTSHYREKWDITAIRRGAPICGATGCEASFLASQQL
jgi:hypothetical protein